MSVKFEQERGIVVDKHPVEYVRKFHEAYGHPIKDKPEVPEAARRLLRVRLLMEEAAEFCRASGFPVKVYGEAIGSKGHLFMVPLTDLKPHDSQDKLVDIVEVADGIGDVNVVNNGSALEWGIPVGAVDREIHRSNGSKLGADGKPITDEHGKTLKGPNYTPPDIRTVLRKYGWDEKAWSAHFDKKAAEVCS